MFIKLEKDTRKTMFIEALFARATLWKQPRCLTTDEWIVKNMVFIYNICLFNQKEKHFVCGR
jgi:hypothetical protein